MKLRQHTGSLAASMATTIEIEPSIDALADTIRSTLDQYGIDALGPVHVEPYGGIDARTGWDTHIVIVDGYGVYGFTDGAVSGRPVACLVGPNVRGNLDAEAGVGWLRKDNLRQRLERPDGGCRSGSG